MRILKALLLPFLLILSLVGVDRLSAKKIDCSDQKTCSHPVPSVGASLLAMRASHSAYLLTGRSLSRAGSTQEVCDQGGMCGIPAMAP